MKIDQKLFLDVELNSKGPNPCSPEKPGAGWRGIIINAPEQVKFKRGEKVGEYGAFAAIPICGYYCVNVPSVPDEKPMRLIATNTKDGKTYTGQVTELDTSPDEPSPREGISVSPEDVKGLAIGKYFNPNLADFVKLPEESAAYKVWVEFREQRSNVVTIEIVEKKSEPTF